MRFTRHRKFRTIVVVAATIVLTMAAAPRASGVNQRSAGGAANPSVSAGPKTAALGADLLWRIRADRSLAGAAARARSLALARVWRGTRATLRSETTAPGGPSPSRDPYPAGSIHDLIVSLFTRIAGSDQVSTALCVAWRESRFDPYANNPSSSAAGLFQWTASSWSVYSSRYGFGGASAYDAGANAAVAAYAVADGGWGPWGGGC